MANILEKVKELGTNRDELAACDFLMAAKAGVRNYAVAITETASPEVKAVLKKQLNVPCL